MPVFFVMNRRHAIHRHRRDGNVMTQILRRRISKARKTAMFVINLIITYFSSLWSSIAHIVLEFLIQMLDIAKEKALQSNTFVFISRLFHMIQHMIEIVLRQFQNFRASNQRDTITNFSDSEILYDQVLHSNSSRISRMWNSFHDVVKDETQGSSPTRRFRRKRRRWGAGAGDGDGDGDGEGEGEGDGDGTDMDKAPLDPNFDVWDNERLRQQDPISRMAMDVNTFNMSRQRLNSVLQSNCIRTIPSITPDTDDDLGHHKAKKIVKMNYGMRLKHGGPQRSLNRVSQMNRMSGSQRLLIHRNHIREERSDSASSSTSSSYSENSSESHDVFHAAFGKFLPGFQSMSTH